MAFDSVKAVDVYAFLEARMRAEVKPWSMSRAHGIVKRSLREVFDLARTWGLMSGENPIIALRVLPRLSPAEERARSRPRYPFTGFQLTTLYRSDWYDPTATRWRGKMRQDLGARYWVPLICMLHGNRVREVLQLVVSDMRSAGGLPVVEFREEIDGQGPMFGESGIARRLKTRSTSRVVPLHPQLLTLGLMAFVEQRQKDDGPNAVLFPSSLPNSGGRAPMIGRAYEQAFLRFVRDELGFGNGYGNHSFRHQLEDRIRAAQTPRRRWPPGLAQAYTGRKRLREVDRGVIDEEGSEAAYGHGYAPMTMLKYTSTIPLEDVTFPAPYLEWLRRLRSPRVAKT